MDADHQRIRIWNIHRKDLLNEHSINQGTFQNFTIHSISNESSRRQEYLIIAKSINERNLLLFEYTRPSDESTTVESSNLAVC